MRYALCVMATPLAAQSAQQWQDSAHRLSEQVRALRDSLLQGDSTVREVARHGDLVIGASESLRQAASAALLRFVEARRHWFGDASPSPGGFRIVLRATEQEASFRPPAEWAAVVLAGMPDSGNSARQERQVRRSEIAEVLIDIYAEMMWPETGPAIAKWLQQPPPLSMGENNRRVAAMYGLVTGTGSAQRACVSGVLADCAYALWLRESSGQNPGGGYSVFLRADLLLTALELGGSGAWARLSGARDSSVASALAAAAAMPIDSLLARWRSQLLAFRPISAPLGISGAGLALAWTVLALLSALGVSRWA